MPDPIRSDRPVPPPDPDHGRLRGWLRRNVIRIAAGLTGVAGFLGVLVGSDEITARTWVVALIIGVFTSVPVVLIEDRVRALSALMPSTSPPVRWPRTWAAAAKPVGQSLSTFRGRSAELTELLAIHAQERQARDRGEATGAVLLLIHGKPGVGKSALAQELAHRLAPQYPDGVLSENFGTAGGLRPPAEILWRFLGKLGRKKSGDAIDPASLLRSLTADKRILFIFDAARHHDQVNQVMPTEPKCAVIITSRRDFGAALNVPISARLPLEVPPMAEALDILAAATQTGWETHAEAAIEVVEECGRLPMAIASAAERVTLDGTDLRHVADLLRPEYSRLDWLERGGRGVKERLLSEYQRLVLKHQRALCLLTLVESPTFVPWVLRPLLDIEQPEAENVMAMLGAAQLLDNAGHDRASGLVRYRFNPLVRLLAEEMLAEHRAQVPAARDRLEEAYLEVVDNVLAVLGDGYSRTRVDRWVPATSQVPLRIAELPEDEVRAEYPNLVHLVTVAFRHGEHAMCWRVAAWLQGCVPAHVAHAETLDAFDMAVNAACIDQTPIGEIDVRLSKATFLIAVERYAEAFEVLSQADRHAAELREKGVQVDRAGVQRATIERKLAEAYLQMGAYRRAAFHLDRAARLATSAGNAEELRLIRLLCAENHRVPGPDPSYPHDDPVFFRAHLGSSEAGRRRGYWERAEKDLLEVERHSHGDTRRAATVHYRLARLYIDQWRSASGGWEISDLPAMAIRRAAEATLVFSEMDNLVGVVRAQCQHGRALTIAGHLIEAEQLLDRVWQSLWSPALSASPARVPLLARFYRARGELLLHHGDIARAWRTLAGAATLYAANDDWACHREIWQLLHTVQCNYPYPKDGGPSGMEAVLDEVVTAVR